jgi:hypothetical protein
MHKITHVTKTVSRFEIQQQRCEAEQHPVSYCQPTRMTSLHHGNNFSFLVRGDSLGHLNGDAGEMICLL